MEKAIIGKKVGMSQIFDTDGKVIPVTVIEAGPCVVVQKKTAEKDGYEAVQLGFEDVPERKLTKPERGHLAKAGVSPKKHLKEFQLKKAAEGKIIVVDSIAMDSIKTKAFRGFLDAVNCDGKAVVITPEVNENVVKSARNIPGVLTTTARILSVYDILNAKYLVIDQAALATIEEVYA